jgi:hypothetical protein
MLHMKLRICFNVYFQHPCPCIGDGGCMCQKDLTAYVRACTDFPRNEGMFIRILPSDSLRPMLSCCHVAKFDFTALPAHAWRWPVVISARKCSREMTNKIVRLPGYNHVTPRNLAPNPGDRSGSVGRPWLTSEAGADPFAAGRRAGPCGPLGFLTCNFIGM